MRGQVLCYRPGAGDGAILDCDGRLILIDPASGPRDLRGGDVVAFDALPDRGRLVATGICVLESVESDVRFTARDLRDLLCGAADD